MTSCNCAHMFFLNMRPGCGVFQGTQRGLSFFSVSTLDILSQQTCSQFMLKLTFLFKICASATVLVSTSLDRDKSNARNKMQLPAMEILTGCLGKSIALTSLAQFQTWLAAREWLNHLSCLHDWQTNVAMQSALPLCPHGFWCTCTTFPKIWVANFVFSSMSPACFKQSSTEVELVPGIPSCDC